MTSPEFRLLPWERGGHPVTPFVEMSATVEGRMRRFHVKTHDGAVYFRFADEDDERIWTLLLPEREHDLETVFQSEVQANRVARFFCTERVFSTQTVSKEFPTELSERFHSSNLRLLGPTALAVTVDSRGHVFVQEWCGGPWFGLKLSTRKPKTRALIPSIWHRGWNVAGLQGALSWLAGEIAFRPFGVDLETQETQRFVCGSRNELEVLIRTACIYFIPLTGYDHYLRRANLTLNYTLRVYSETQAMGLKFYQGQDIVPTELINLFIAYHRPGGGEWRANRYRRIDFEVNVLSIGDEAAEFSDSASDEPVLRVDFHFTPSMVPLHFRFTQEPSAHERMEAFLTLRDWLERIGEGHRIKELLAI